VSLAAGTITAIPLFEGYSADPPTAPTWNVAIVDPAFLPLWLLMGDVKIVGGVGKATKEDILPRSSSLYTVAEPLVSTLKEQLHKTLSPFVTRDSGYGGMAAKRLGVAALEQTFTSQVQSVVSKFFAKRDDLLILPALTMKLLGAAIIKKDVSISNSKLSRIVLSELKRDNQVPYRSASQNENNEQGVNNGTCTPSYLHQAPIFGISATDILCGFSCDGNWFPTSICESGDGNKTLQLYRYVHNAMRAYVGYPQNAPSIVGLRSSNPLNFGTEKKNQNGLNLYGDIATITCNTLTSLSKHIPGTGCPQAQMTALIGFVTYMCGFSLARGAIRL